MALGYTVHQCPPKPPTPVDPVCQAIKSTPSSKSCPYPLPGETRDPLFLAGVYTIRVLWSQTRSSFTKTRRRSVLSISASGALLVVFHYLGGNWSVSLLAWVLLSSGLPCSSCKWTSRFEVGTLSHFFMSSSWSCRRNHRVAWCAPGSPFPLAGQS